MKFKKIFTCFFIFILLTAFLAISSVYVSAKEAASFDQLENNIKFIVKNQEKNMDIGIAAYHVEEDKWIKINAYKSFPLASVFKVPVMLELLRQIDDGRRGITLDTNIILKESDKCIGSGSIKDFPSGKKISVKYCLYKMITVSDNTAADLIWNLIGQGSVNKLLKNMGLKNTNIYISNRPSYLISLGMGSEFLGMSSKKIAEHWLGKSMDERKKIAEKVLKEFKNLSIRQFEEIERESELKQKGSAYYDDVIVAEALDNYGSPHDMSVLFLKVYKKEVLSPSLTEVFFDTLLKQEYNTRIPGLLPEGVKVYHKTGTIAGVVNDAGLIEISDDNHIILAVFIKNIKENCQQDASRLISIVAKYLYDFYEN